MGMGILGGDIAAGPQAWTNRQHPRVHQVYANLFGTEKLISSVDRCVSVTAHAHAPPHTHTHHRTSC
jgi:hypothetical protein